MLPKKFCLVAITNKLDHKDKCKKNGILQNNYIIDTSLGNEQATIREVKFLFGKAEDGFCYNDQLTECFGLGNVSVFHTFRWKEG